MKMNPFLQEFYKLENQVGSVALLDDTDPRIKRLSGMSYGRTRNRKDAIKIKVLELIHLGLDTPGISKRLGFTEVYIRRVIRKYNLVINYVVIEDVKTHDKLFFKDAKSMLEVFKENNINIGYRSILNHMDTSKLYEGRYQLYRDKKIKELD